MIVQFKAVLKNIEHGEARVHVETKLKDVYKPLLAPVFVALLRAMKDADKRAFYEAMENFINDDLCEFIDGECEND